MDEKMFATVSRPAAERIIHMARSISREQAEQFAATCRLLASVESDVPSLRDASNLARAILTAQEELPPGA